MDAVRVDVWDELGGLYDSLEERGWWLEYGGSGEEGWIGEMWCVERWGGGSEVVWG